MKLMSTVLKELYNDRSGGGNHGHPFFHRITAIDGNFNETKIREGHGDPEHWLRVAHQISLRNPNHIVKIAHHQLVHFRNGGSGYEFRRNRYFHQGRETSLTNLHELYDDRKSGGGNHWGAPYLYSVHSDSKQFHEGYGDTDAFESYHEKAKKVSSNNLGKPIHLNIYQIHYDENQKRYTGYRLVKHKLYMNGVHLHDLNEEIQLNELYDDKRKKEDRSWNVVFSAPHKENEEYQMYTIKHRGLTKDEAHYLSADLKNKHLKTMEQRIIYGFQPVHDNEIPKHALISGKYIGF